MGVFSPHCHHWDDLNRRITLKHTHQILEASAPFNCARAKYGKKIIEWKANNWKENIANWKSNNWKESNHECVKYVRWYISIFN